MAAGRGNAFGMELNAVDRAVGMLQSHDNAVRGLCGDRQAVGPARAIDDEGVIARRLERVGQAGEEPGATMADGAELAMHGLRRANDVAAEDLADRLMAETDAEDRKIAGAADEVEADAGAVGIARSRRDNDTLRLQGERGLDGHGVVALHHDLGAELAEIVAKVADEAVVIIDEQKHISDLRPVAQAPTRADRGSLYQVAARSGMRRNGRPEDALDLPADGNPIYNLTVNCKVWSMASLLLRCSATTHS